MEPALWLTAAAVFLVVFFDYTNGFHDAANILATVVASRAMTPAQAVVLVACFEFLGPLLAGTAVADTIGGFVSLGDLPAGLSLTLLLCGLGGAIGWNLITWWRGIPSSSSHALVGAMVGVVLVAAGTEHVVWGFRELAAGHLKGVVKILLALLVSPLAGFGVGFVVHRTARFVLRGARPSVNRYLRFGQYLTAAGLAFSHGANDAQKSMGMLTLALVLGGFLDTFQVPFWVVLTCSGALALGILSGGWRIVRTLGFSIYRVRPLHALDSQLSSAAVILSASLWGGPVSTTHVVASSIMGIGASERVKAVRWGKAREIVVTWLITLPGSALLAVALFSLTRVFT